MSEGEDLLRICTYPNAVLRERAEDILEIDDRVRELAGRMAATMHANRGVGLAGPQVGVGKRIVVVNPTGEPEDEKVLINPAVVSSRGQIEGPEGCLSVPGVAGDVRRNSRVEVVAYDLEGAELEITASDFFGRVLQHEIDHLDGMLITDRMTPESRINAREVLRVLEENDGHLPEGFLEEE